MWSMMEPWSTPTVKPRKKTRKRQGVEKEQWRSTRRMKNLTFWKPRLVYPCIFKCSGDHSAFHLSLAKTSLDSALPSNENGGDGGKLTLAILRGVCGCEIQKHPSALFRIRRTGSLGGKRHCFNLPEEESDLPLV